MLRLRDPRTRGVIDWSETAKGARDGEPNHRFPAPPFVGRSYSPTTSLPIGALASQRDMPEARTPEVQRRARARPQRLERGETRAEEDE